MSSRAFGLALIASLATHSLGAPALRAQATTAVTLQAFTTSAEAERYVSQLVEQRDQESRRLAALYRCRPRGTLEEVLGWRRDSSSPRRRNATPVDTTLPLCPERRRDELGTSVVILPTARYLVTYDTGTAERQNGGAVQRVGDGIVTAPGGQLTHFDVRGDPPAVLFSRKAVTHRFDYSPGGWADEVVFSGDVAALLDYGATRNGTKLLLFTKRADGTLVPRDSITLSGVPPTGHTNTALRLRGNQLVVYATAQFPYVYQDPVYALAPYVRGAGDREASEDAWRESLRADRVFRPMRGIDSLNVSTIHHIIQCDITAPTLSCESTSFLAPNAQTFSLLDSVLYVVTDDATPPRSPAARREAARGSLVIRVPLTGGAPTAFRVQGRPADRFALHEHDAVLSAILTSATRFADRMSDPAATPPDSGTRFPARLLSVVLESNSGGNTSTRAQVRDLAFSADSIALTQFVGRYALFTAFVRDAGRASALRSAGGDATIADTLFIAHLDSDAQWRIPVPHSIDRIADLQGRVLLLGRSGSGVSASLVTPGTDTAPRHTVTLPGARGDWPGHGTLAVQKVRPVANHFRAAFPVRMPAPGLTDDSYVDHNALWLIDARDSLSSLGVLAADSTTLKENARVFPLDYQLGLVEGVWYDDRIFGLFYNELVAARIVDGRVRPLSRVKAPSLPRN
jgi:hypothetical protein